MTPCADFMPRCNSELCHICLQPRNLHPTDADSAYWYQWLIWSVLLELASPRAVLHLP